MRRAQAATEAVVAIAAILSALLVIIGLLYGIGTTARTTYGDGVAWAAVNDLANAAIVVWYQGEGARQTVFIQPPESITNITIAQNIIVLSRGEGASLRSFSRSLEFNVSGNLSTTRSGYWAVAERVGTQVIIKAVD